VMWCGVVWCDVVWCGAMMVRCRCGELGGGRDERTWYLAVPPPTAASTTPVRAMVKGLQLSPFCAEYFSTKVSSSSVLSEIVLIAFWMGGDSAYSQKRG